MDEGARTNAGSRDKDRSRSSSRLSLPGLVPTGRGEREEPDFNAKAYLDKRVMSSAQEWFNAFTMLPGMLYSLDFLVGGRWREGVGDDSTWTDDAWTGGGACLPPLPLVAGASACLLYSSCSILHHCLCAVTLAPSARVAHWSRRLDAASIHLASAIASYATTGRADYCLLTLLFNLDCIAKQFEEEIRPRRNLARTAASILLYVLPTLACDRSDIFWRFLVMFAVAGWLFVCYPVAGWSHGLFHLVLGFLPVLVIAAAMELESTRIDMAMTSRCGGVSLRGNGG